MMVNSLIVAMARLAHGQGEMCLMDLMRSSFKAKTKLTTLADLLTVGQKV